MAKYRFILSGGGTGGHIFPALAIADELKQRYPDAQFLFVGAQDRMEMQRIPQAGYKIEGLWISGLQRKLSIDNLSFPFKVFSSLRKSRKILKEFKPDVAIGTGGYASGPLLYAASAAKIPCLIQEQNSYPGITNKILAKRVQSICVAYDRMKRFFPKEKLVFTGNPLRKNLLGELPNAKEARENLGFDPNAPTLLILGGSLGARTINQWVSSALKEWEKRGYNILWQCGKLYEEQYQNKHQAELGKQTRITAFIKEMNWAFAAADLVISRAGANTLSELAAVGKASILIPSPNVAEDHQTKNARALTEKGAAILIEESRGAEALNETVISLMQDEVKRQQLSKGISKLAKPQATEEIVNEIEKLLHGKRP